MKFKDIVEAKKKYEEDFKSLHNEILTLVLAILVKLREDLGLDPSDTRFIKIFNSSLIGKKMTKEELINLGKRPEQALSEKEGYYECSFMALIGESLQHDLQIIVSGIIISKDLESNRYLLIFSLEKDKLFHSLGAADTESIEKFSTHISKSLLNYYNLGIENWLNKFEKRMIIQ
ncbi:hypothetical protein [Leptospira bandrabouensis]|uniref:hypothetical protein n=1 Tax=Leptospira bandrabouensis TaxID=2484903 RepID=UPI001EE949ED|nr:hypothetical protein [Leptospira bandrabouensis]MCG6146567.1 hypothetical protein [Leptospira bandrabouensis]MCG6161982.1 hypothetical protein [Leptospira bandrabouensis]MCG6166166.1 hypothetical protein [Leptospira bandrabouensis]